MQLVVASALYQRVPGSKPILGKFPERIDDTHFDRIRSSFADHCFNVSYMEKGQWLVKNSLPSACEIKSTKAWILALVSLQQYK